MRITIMCKGDGRKAAIQQDIKTGEKTPSILYYAEFGTSPVKAGVVQSHTIQLEINSLEPLHFKPNKKYTIDINEHSGLITDLGSQVGREN